MPAFKAKKKKAEIVLQWHPNFRVADALPDIKTVRTDFLINSVAVTLALFAFAWLVSVGVSKFQISRETSAAQVQIDELTKKNTTFLNDSKKFVRDSKRVQELAKFYSQNIPPLQLLAVLAEFRPPNILFDTISIDPLIIEVSGKKLNSQRISLAGTLSGEAEDLRDLNTLIEKVLAAPVLKDRIADPAKDCKIDPPRREGHVFKFSLTIVLKPVT